MSTLLHHAQVFFKRNGATILTCLGGAGVVVTTITAVKATPKALTLLEEAKQEKGEELTKWEICKVTSPVYIPTVLFGVSTIACIVGANVLNKRQQAALVSAYALIDNSYKEYRTKVKELYGTEADKKVNEEIAKDKYEETDILVSDDKELFYDSFSKRYFESTLADVIQAEYELNKKITVFDGAYLNEFYELLDIPETIEGKEFGWSIGILEAMYWKNWVDFKHEKVTLDDGLECTIITMIQEPVIDFAYY